MQLQERSLIYLPFSNRRIQLVDHEHDLMIRESNEINAAKGPADEQVTICIVNTAMNFIEQTVGRVKKRRPKLIVAILRSTMALSRCNC